MTPRFTFQRRIRTASSEQYNVYDARSSEAREAVGQIDFHFITPTRIEVSAILFKEYPDDDVEELLAALDDDALGAATMEDRVARMVVFTGKETGYFEFNTPLLLEEPELDEEVDVV